MCSLFFYRIVRKEETNVSDNDNDNDNDNKVYSWSQVETKEPGGQHDSIKYLH